MKVRLVFKGQTLETTKGIKTVKFKQLNHVVFTDGSRLPYTSLIKIHESEKT